MSKWRILFLLQIILQQVFLIYEDTVGKLYIFNNFRIRNYKNIQMFNKFQIVSVYPSQKRGTDQMQENFFVRNI